MEYITLSTPPFPYFIHAGSALYRPGDRHRRRSNLKVFDIIYVLTNGGPGHATEVITTYSYQLYSSGQYGMSTALNTVLLAIAAIIGILVVKFMAGKEVQQG